MCFDNFWYNLPGNILGVISLVSVCLIVRIVYKSLSKTEQETFEENIDSLIKFLKANYNQTGNLLVVVNNLIKMKNSDIDEAQKILEGISDYLKHQNETRLNRLILDIQASLDTLNLDKDTNN